MKRRILPLLLAGCLLLSGCSQQQSSAAAGDPAFDISALAQTSAAEKAAKECLENSNHASILCLYKNGRLKCPGLYQSILYTYRLTSAYSLTQEYYKAHADEIDTSYSEYVARRLEKDPSLKKYINKDLTPKGMPDDRVYFNVYYNLADGQSEIDPELLRLGIEKAFALYEEDPTAAEMLTNAIRADFPQGGSAYEGHITIRQKDAATAAVEARLSTLDGSGTKCKGVVCLNGEPTDQFLGSLAVTAANRLGMPIKCTLSASEAEYVYDALRELHDSAPRSEGEMPEEAALVIEVNNKFESEYRYLGEGRWYYTDMLEAGCVLTGGEAAADAVYLAASLTSLAEEGESVSVGESYTKSRLAAAERERDGESLNCYVDDRTSRQYVFQSTKEGVYYYEGSSTRTDAEVGGQPYYQNTDEYEFFGNTTEAYYRPEMYDVFYPADRFEGEWELTPLARRLGSFAGGTEVQRGKASCACEFYRSDTDSIAVLLDADGHITAAWEYGADDLLLIQSVRTVESFNIEELLEHAREHTEAIENQKKLDAKKTADDWRREDLEKLGLPDLAGKITQKGDPMTESPVVQGYLDYLCGGNPFTLRWYMVGSFRCDEELLTTSGIDLYDSEVVSSHDNSFDYELTEIILEDACYMTDDDGNFKRYDKGEGFTDQEILYHLPDALRSSEYYHFCSAYEGEVNGETYTIEEWDLNGNQCVFFCQDGQIIGYRHKVFDNLYYFYPTEYTRTADTTLLRAPEAKRADPNQ